MPPAERSLPVGVDVWLVAQLQGVPNAPVSQLRDALTALDAPLAASPLPYDRVCLWQNNGCEVLLMTWSLHQPSAIHDHGGGHGGVFVLRGCVEEERWPTEIPLRNAVAPVRLRHVPGSSFHVAERVFHRMTSVGATVAQTLHVYHGVLRGMRLPDPIQRRTWLVPKTHGAWLPTLGSPCEEEPWQ